MSRKLKTNRLIFFDLETTGLDTNRDKIIQLGAVAVDQFLEIVESFEAKIQLSAEHSSSEALAITHFNAARWQLESRSPRAVAQEFALFLKRHAFISKATAVGKPYFVSQLASYNAPFDAPFLFRLFESTNTFLPASRQVVCVLDRARWFLLEDARKRPPRDMKLSTVAEWLRVPMSGQAHDALCDAGTALAVYRELRRRSVMPKRPTKSAFTVRHQRHRPVLTPY